MTDPLTLWVGAFATIAVLSYLAKDNALYRLVQQAALGAAVGIGIVRIWQDVLEPNWWLPIRAAFGGKGHWTGALWLLALIPGSLWYFQLSKKWFWVSRLVSGLFIGVAAGLAFKSQILLVLPQLGASLKPLNPFAAPGGLSAASALGCLSNLVFLAGMLGALLYFFFSLRAESPLVRHSMRFGRLTIMVCLGAMFASTVMTRMAYLLDRFQFLLERGGEAVGALVALLSRL